MNPYENPGVPSGISQFSVVPLNSMDATNRRHGARSQKLIDPLEEVDTFGASRSKRKLRGGTRLRGAQVKNRLNTGSNRHRNPQLNHDKAEVVLDSEEERDDSDDESQDYLGTRSKSLERSRRPHQHYKRKKSYEDNDGEEYLYLYSGYP